MCKIINIKLLDIGTGSGAIGLVVKKIKDNIDVTLLDKSIRALNVAKQNAESLGLDVKLIHISLYIKLK